MVECPHLPTVTAMPRVPLSAIAHGRSGDKGNHANIAILAYTLPGFRWIREYLTAERLTDVSGGLGLAWRKWTRWSGSRCR